MHLFGNWQVLHCPSKLYVYFLWQLCPCPVCSKCHFVPQNAIFRGNFKLCPCLEIGKSYNYYCPSKWYFLWQLYPCLVGGKCQIVPQNAVFHDNFQLQPCMCFNCPVVVKMFKRIIEKVACLVVCYKSFKF